MQCNQHTCNKKNASGEWQDQSSEPLPPEIIEAMKTTVGACGRTLLFLDNSGDTLKRIWVLYEVGACAVSIRI